MNAPQPISLRAADPLPPRAHVALRQAADEVVGQIFYGTMLRQMRSSSLKGKYGHGGRGEQVFAAQLDQVLAERAGRTGRIDLADALVRKFERRAAAVEARQRQLRQMTREAQQELSTQHREFAEDRMW